MSTHQLLLVFRTIRIQEASAIMCSNNEPRTASNSSTKGDHTHSPTTLHITPDWAEYRLWRALHKRYVAEELAAAGVAVHLAEPADTAFARGRKRHAKTDKTDSRHLRMLLAEGRLPECWIPPSRILECRALLETYHDLRAEHTAWVQRIHAVLFHQGAPALGEGTLRSEQGVAALRAAAAAHLSPAGQLQVATALEVIEALEARLHELRHQLLDAARHLSGAKVLAARLYGVGPVTALAMTCSWLSCPAFSGQGILRLFTRLPAFPAARP